MRASIAAMAVVLIALVAVAAHKGVVGQGLRQGGGDLVKFMPILLIAFLLSGFVDVLLPRGLVHTWLSDASGWRGLAVGWLAGVLTPGGSIIGMPLAASLARSGVGPGVLVTYLTSLATLSFLRVPLEIGFYGWRLTLLRVLASLVLPFVAGLTARAIAGLVMSSG